MISPPSFWNSKNGAKHPLAIFLSPLSHLYAYFVERKLRETSTYTAACPVICVGNITMGGVGKTPFTDFLMDALSKLGETPHILMRGYGGKLSGPIQVESKHTAEDVGDEAKMLSQNWPVWISSDRPAGASAASMGGASVIVMDDGFQNPSLHKDYSFVLIDTHTQFGNGRVFPAGPLREKPELGLQRADAIILVGSDFSEIKTNELNLPASTPIFRASLKTDVSGLATDKKLLAFAGIGRPDKFFDSLTSQGFKPVSTVSFPDHHPFTDEEIEKLQQRSTEMGAQLITTEKDIARLSPKQSEGIKGLPAEFNITPLDELQKILKNIIKKDEVL